MPLKDGLNRNFSWYGKYKLLNKKHISISSIKKMSQCSSVDRECSICKAKNFSNNYKIENFLFLMLQRSNLDKPFPVLFISPHRIFWSVPSSPRRTHISWSPDQIISLSQDQVYFAYSWKMVQVYHFWSQPSFHISFYRAIKRKILSW